MPCYSIGHITVTNTEGYKEYAAQVPATIAAHGGKYLVRGGQCNDVEGKMPHSRHVVLEFPTRAALEGWYFSAEYQALLKIRLANSEGMMTFVDGFDG
ncbi:MAG: DUF1330 domain-containing protein [Burkholderiaceae bacterium]